MLVAAATAAPSSSAGSSSPEGTSAKLARGGTFRMSLDTDIDYADPGKAYYVPSWEMLFASCALLVNYPDAPAPRGSRLYPEAAASMPTVSRDGRTYTFRVRTGRRAPRFDNGRPVTARNYAFAIQRVLNPRMESDGAPFFNDIVGAKAFQDGQARRVSGLRVLRGNRLQIRLTKRRPDLVPRLAMQFACPLPTNTPIDAEGVPPSQLHYSGPFRIAAWNKGRSITMVRNRFYRGPRRPNVNRIEVDIGKSLETIRLEIEQGKTDHGGVPPAAHSELGRRYGVRRRGNSQYFVNPAIVTRYIAMNHDRQLFGGNRGRGNLQLKKAVNYAIDRVGLMQQRGAYAGVEDDQVLAPGVPGYRNRRFYPNRPNVAQARRLARGNTRGGKAVLWTCNRGPCIPSAQLIQRDLARINIDVDIRPLPRAIQFTRAGDRAAADYDMTFEGWHADYLDPYDFINVLLQGRDIRPAGNNNYAYWNNPTFNARMERAAGLTGDRRYRTYTQLDWDIARNGVPWAAWGHDNDRLFFSRRTGCFFYHPIYTLDLVGICLERR